MIVLALDIATRTGFAVGAPGRQPENSGSLRFVGDDHEAIFADALKWCAGMLRTYHPHIVAWEAPIAVSFKRGFTNVNTTKILYGLPAVFGATARLLGIADVREVPVQTIRRVFLGNGRIKKAVAKRLVMRECRARGWEPVDDNEADALALWSCVCDGLSNA